MSHKSFENGEILASQVMNADQTDPNENTTAGAPGEGVTSVASAPGTGNAGGANGQTEAAVMDEGMTIADLLRIVGKHIVAAVVTFLVVVAGVVAYTFMTPKQYTAEAQLFAAYATSADPSGTSSEISQMQTGGTYIASQIKSYPTLAKTETVLSPALKALGNDDLTMDQLAGMITITNPDDTYVIELSAVSRDPQQAADTANAVADSLSKVVSGSLYGTHQSPVRLSVIQKADVPAGASSPKVKLNLAVGIVAGLVLGVVAALLRDILSRRIRDTDDLQSVAGDANVMGLIPQDDKLSETKPIVITSPDSTIAEEFRRIRTNLSFTTSTTEGNSRLFVITSAGPSEGKTTLAVNIAAALAENDARVLLIDADLRHPSVADRMGVQGSVGLAHVLSRQASVKDAVQRYWKPNFHVLPAGPRLQNASVLLNSDIMKALINQALRQYDYVIIDTSPMSIANDAAVFGKISGGVMMVVSKDIAFKRSLSEILRQFATLNVPVLGFVFNRADVRKRRGGDYYYYYYAEDDASNPRHSDTQRGQKNRKAR